MLSASEIRQQFLAFFVHNHTHTLIPSAPIVVKNDPTLMFTNAGMNQFKDYFLGYQAPPHTRVVNTQKCLRVSGKHNDLEEVGIDTYHHTMFEMLGNWSFGDYFKQEAIQWSWQLLTDVYQIPKDRIYVTYFQGDTKEGLEADEQTQGLWRKYLSEDRILGFGKKDNFWEMGDTGPCGPCTEIHIDTREDDERKQISGKDLVNQDHPLVIEIWNNVFIQYNRLKDGSLQDLPQKHVDTGMGFERLVRVIQQKTSNYDTDVFAPLFYAITQKVGRLYTGTQSPEDVAFRVLADHVRAICFTIADGQLPSHVGAGYVVRRILRRAIRYYYSSFHYEKPLLYELVPTLAEQFKGVFDALFAQQDFIAKVILQEETNFLQTIASGMRRIEHYFDTLSLDKVLHGEVAFELYDTFGFPLDLTTMLAKEKGFRVDVKGFELAMQVQKDRSKAAAYTDTSDWIQYLEQADKQAFVGYDTLEINTSLVQYRSVYQKDKQLYQWVLAQTPFYAEAGGQVGDTGELVFGDESVRVVDTKKENDLILHFTEVLPRHITPILFAKVDAKRRAQICAHHSATHLLQAALKQHFGAHIQQKGAFLCAEYLRFDFTHPQKISDTDLHLIEEIIYQKIQQHIPVHTSFLPKEEAIKRGATALFGEKYGSVVRMVAIDEAFSLELCGGTHVRNSGEIGMCILRSESAVASGVRRIEAFCGDAANQWIHKQLEELKTIRHLLKNPLDCTKSIQTLLYEKQTLQKQIEDLHTQMAKQSALVLTRQKSVSTQGLLWVMEKVHTSSIEVLKKIGLELRHTLQDAPYCICVASVLEREIHYDIQIDDTTSETKQINLFELSKEVLLPLIQGKGGGQKKSVYLRGSNLDSFDKVCEVLRARILER